MDDTPRNYCDEALAGADIKQINAGPQEIPASNGDATGADAEITRLAKLSLVVYEQKRKAAAEKLDVRASILDKLVQAERERQGLKDDGKQGTTVTFEDIEPWPEPVDGAKLLDDLATTIRNHVVISDYERDICALWTVHTYVIKHF